MSDEEWGFFEPFVIERGPRRGRRPRDHRLVLDGVFWIARTGSAWRDLHDHFGKWSSVYRQFRRWTLSGVWDVMLAAVNDSGAGQDSVQMIDSTILADLEDRGIAAVIPPKRNRKVQPIIDGHLYALRNLVERCFSKLKHSRRLATRYDKTADSYIGFILIASTRLWVRHFVNRT